MDAEAILTPAERIEQLCVRFEDQWGKGAQPQIADYLRGVLSANRSELFLELLLLEVEYRQRRGEEVKEQEYCQAYPAQTAEVRAAFARIAARTPTIAPVSELASFSTQRETFPPAFEGYEILRELGRGGMGVVYHARQTATGREVALKAIRPNLGDDSRMERRFAREIIAMSQLRHRRIVDFIEARETTESLFFVMEFLQTIDLPRELAVRSPKSRLRIATGLMSQVLDALNYAHSLGWLHRDLKPANVLIEAEGKKWRAKVSDFGLAKNLERAGFSCMTEAGQALGSVPYMAPEQVRRARDVTARADLFSAGATLYAWLTERPPVVFPPGSDALRIAAECNVVPIQDRAPDLPRSLCDFVQRALAKDPVDRFSSASEMREELDRVRSECMR